MVQGAVRFRLLFLNLKLSNMNKKRIMDEVKNFIEYYTSSDEVRQQMYLTLQDYLDEVYEESTEK
jgi:hypothetical protein